MTYEDTQTGEKHWTHHPSLGWFAGRMSACGCKRVHTGVPCKVNELVDSSRYLNKYRVMFQDGEGAYVLAAADYVNREVEGKRKVREPARYFAKICSQERWKRTRKMLIETGLPARYELVGNELVHDDIAEARFRAKVDWRPGLACSTWVKGLDRDGYPRHYVGNKEVRAHRWYFANVILPDAQADFWETGDLGAFARAVGLADDLDLARMLVTEELPEDWDIDHTCGNRACMKHLRPMPKEINRSRTRNPRPEEVERHVELTRIARRLNWNTLGCCQPLCQGEVVGVIFKKSGGKKWLPICHDHYDVLMDRWDADEYVLIGREGVADEHDVVGFVPRARRER
jgi:hypothetical protein